MTRIAFLATALGMALSVASVSPASAQQTDPVRSIQHLAGDVYYFRNNNHYGIFTVGSEGIILVDPIDTSAGEWLKGEVARRFKQPVRTIIYSHHDGDHSGGAEAYKDTVKEIVAHENAPAGILIDDRVSVMPTRTFSGRTKVTLGNKTVELIEVGPGHTNNLVAARFPEERILFIVDIFSGKRLPFNGIQDGYDVDTVVGTLRHIETMDFDILAPGHTGLSNIAELVAFRTFLENLRAQVLQYRKERKTVDEMKKLIAMDAYRDWVNYKTWLAPSIEGMNRYLAGKGL